MEAALGEEASEWWHQQSNHGYEFPALEGAWKHCSSIGGQGAEHTQRAKKHAVLYLHTKGSTKPDWLGEGYNWRNIMSHFTIDHFLSCLQQLQCGYRYCLYYHHTNSSSAATGTVYSVATVLPLLMRLQVLYSLCTTLYSLHTVTYSPYTALYSPYYTLYSLYTTLYLLYNAATAHAAPTCRKRPIVRRRGYTTVATSGGVGAIT
jgi:hypothetical protein